MYEPNDGMRDEPENPFGAVPPDALWPVGGVPLLDGSAAPATSAGAAADWRMRQEAVEAPQMPATQAAGSP